MEEPQGSVDDEEEAVLSWGHKLSQAARAQPQDFLAQAAYAHYLADLTPDFKGAVSRSMSTTE